MKRFKLLSFLAFGVFFMSSTAALAADEIIYTAPDRSVVVLGGIGYAWLKSNEIVYDDDGNRISHLIWKSDSPVLTAKLKAEVINNWTVSANATIGLSGSGRMVDYDWQEQSPSFQFSDWSARSIHPDTNLDRYINLDIAVGRDFILSHATVNLHGGFKYTNTKWSAYGGSYVYSSDDGFRDDIGNFRDGEPAITYEQRYPGVFLGAEATGTAGKWTFTGLVRGGVSFRARGTDHHWMRDIRFEDRYRNVPFVSIGATVDYQMTDRARLFLAGNYERHFRRMGDETLHDLGEGTAELHRNTIRTDLSAVTVSAGLKVAF